MIAHLDLDAFFAAVEELERPELRLQPLVVGGSPYGRGVVATANYEARRYGIRSAMPCAEALRRCPHAVFVSPRKSLYADYSRTVWRAVGALVPQVEQTGIDEGYLALGHDGSAEGAAGLARSVQEEVQRAANLTCSMGVAATKVVAKVASDRHKPAGLTVVAPGDERSFLAPFGVRLLPGVGPRTQARLGAAGVQTIGDLASLGAAELDRLVPGKLGRLLADRARGVDARRVETVPAAVVSISAEETFERDVDDRARLHAELQRLASEVADRLRGRGDTARTVTAKLRYGDFSIRSRSTTLAVGTDDSLGIGRLACLLLDRALADRPGALRLVGVGVSGLERHGQLRLLEA